ncbi:MAG: hypothetical protein U0791_09090 [Gemmataceae bacterium]
MFAALGITPRAGDGRFAAVVTGGFVPRRHEQFPGIFRPDPTLGRHSREHFSPASGPAQLRYKTCAADPDAPLPLTRIAFAFLLLLWFKTQE